MFNSIKVTIPVPGLRKRPPVIVLTSMPVWEGVKGLMSVTAAGSKGSTVIVCVAGSSDVDAVGEEELSPPQPATVPTTSSTATTSTAHLRIFFVGYRFTCGVTVISMPSCLHSARPHSDPQLRTRRTVLDS